MWRSWSQAHDYNTCLQYLQSYKMSIVGHRGITLIGDLNMSVNCLCSITCMLRTTDSGYYTLTEVRGYTMYEFIIWVSYLAIKAHTQRRFESSNHYTFIKSFFQLSTGFISMQVYRFVRIDIPFLQIKSKYIQIWKIRNILLWTN